MRSRSLNHVVSMAVMGVYFAHGADSYYRYKEIGPQTAKLYSSIFHKFDQLQGQFCRWWSYLFVKTLATIDILYRVYEILLWECMRKGEPLEKGG